MSDDFRWDIGIDGEPCLFNNPTKPDTTYNTIKGMWSYDENGYPKTGATPFIANRKELTTYKTIKGAWHVNKLVNNNNPYTGFMLLPETKPPSMKWEFAFSDSKRALFSAEKEMRFGIDISADYKFLFSVINE